MSSATGAVTSIKVGDVEIELIDRGKGRPILFLHPGIGIDPDAPVLAELAKSGRVIAPSHPGFGASQLPKGMTSVDDVSYFYLDLLQRLDLRDMLVIGIGLGGWLACEIAAKDCSRFTHLVLANPVGVKIGDRETRDIVDIWSLMPDEVDALAYFDPAAHKRDYMNLPEQVALTASRNREATARLAWSPYMHNPKLKHRLHRVAVPTLFLWGTADRILSEPYGRGFCTMIPGARFETIERAGHYPHLERPDEFARRTLAFADSTAQPRARTA